MYYKGWSRQCQTIFSFFALFFIRGKLYIDEGKTGTSVSSRKDFQRMIRQCRRGKIDLILPKSLSRFARNTLDTVKYTRELRQLGIPVIFEKENLNSISWESEFLLTLYGAFAQSESESISKNVSWGKRQAMKGGNGILSNTRPGTIGHI